MLSLEVTASFIKPILKTSDFKGKGEIQRLWIIKCIRSYLWVFFQQNPKCYTFLESSGQCDFIFSGPNAHRGSWGHYLSIIPNQVKIAPVIEELVKEQSESNQRAFREKSDCFIPSEPKILRLVDVIHIIYLLELIN